MAAHDLVCGGVRRRIGNGNSTLIWGHPWLPDDVNPLIHTPMPAQMSGSLVSGLIAEDSNTWDQDILSDIFLPVDVDRILKLPISPDYEDSWYWYGDPKGCYSVKDGYRWIVGNFDGPQNNFDDWIPLWKIKVPPKWKVFLWRALNNILPVTTNLILKRVEVDPSCPMCGLVHEDVMHALVWCDFSKLVWHESLIQISSIVGNTFIEWFSNLMHTLTEENSCLAVGVLYHIWRGRNSAVWEAALPTPRKTVTVASSTLQSWNFANQPHHVSQHHATSNQPAVTHHPHHQRPSCYFDASYDAASMKATFGAVLLAPDGGFVAACAGPIRDCFSPLMAETIACKEALSWLMERGVDSAYIHSDCAQLCTGLIRTQPLHYSYTGLFLDACKRAIESFAFCQITFVPRLQNTIAHNLAAAATSQDCIFYWDSVPPDSISSLFD